MCQVGKLENKMQTLSYERTYTERWRERYKYRYGYIEKIIILMSKGKLNGYGMSRANKVKVHTFHFISLCLPIKFCL